MSYAFGLNQTRAHCDTAASQVATVDYFYTHRVVFWSARTNSLLSPPSVPLFLLPQPTLFLYHHTQTLPSHMLSHFYCISCTPVLIFSSFKLPPPPFCLIPCLLNQSYIQVKQCPILSSASVSSHSVSPHAICPLHLYTVSFLCLQLCLKVILCLPLSYSFSSLNKYTV